MTCIQTGARRAAPCRSIVVVDDDPNVVELLRNILEKEGYAVEGFTDPSLALTKVGAEAPDLILLDCIMPGIDGRDFMRALELAGIETPIVLLTALSDPNFCVDASRVVVINKPFDVDNLLAEVARSISRAKKARPAAVWLS
jgi:DNA-binding response OmpR family regulator